MNKFSLVIDETYAQTIPMCDPTIPGCQPFHNNIQNSSSTMLVIYNHVNDTLNGNVTSRDFWMVVTNLNATRPPVLRITQTYDLINGSETGTVLQMMPGSFVVVQNNGLSKPITQAYNIMFSGDCHLRKTSRGTIVGVGTIHAGQISNCYISRTLTGK